MSGVQTLSEGVDSYREWATDRRPRIGFGMPWFDDPTGGGLARSEICMMQAFSSVGKTTIALNVVRNNPDIPCLFFSLEMNWRMVAARLAAMELLTSTKTMEARLRSGDEIAELQVVVDKFRAFACDDTPGVKFGDMDESIERATDLLGVKPRLVVVDYLELIGGGGLLGKAEQIDKVAAKLRDWTRKHDVSTIVLHQISQGTGGHKPMAMHEGRYGGYQPMDFVCGAYAPRLDPELDADGFRAVKDEIHFQLLKSRSGSPDPVGKKYRLDPATMRITQWGQPAPLPASSQQSFYEPNRPESFHVPAMPGDIFEVPA